MVMTSCLMIYASLEHLIRKRLKGKPTQNPTARWLFQCFQGVTIIYSKEQGPLVFNVMQR